MPLGERMSTQALEARISHIEGAFDQVNERLGSIDRRLDSMETRFEGRFAQIDQRFIWVIGTIVGTWIATILAIIFHR
jgi:tetrahydromethanopterin S-methyltransferase subunit G